MAYCLCRPSARTVWCKLWDVDACQPCIQSQDLCPQQEGGRRLCLRLSFVQGESRCRLWGVPRGCSLRFHRLLPLPLLLNICPSRDVYSRSPPILVASQPLLLWRRSTGVAPGLRLVLQQLPYFLFSLCRLQMQCFLAYILRRIASSARPRSLYAFQHLVYILLYQVSLYCGCFLHCCYIYVDIKW